MKFMIRSLFFCIAVISLQACGDHQKNDNDESATEQKNTQAAQTADAGNSENSEPQSLGRITLRGELVYRERIALGPDVTASVELLDTGVNGQQRNTITESSLSHFGQVPIAFSLTFPEEAIKPKHRYALRAALHNAEGKTVWSTPEPVSIDPTDMPAVEDVIHTLTLHRVSAEKALSYVCDGIQFKVTATPETATLELGGRTLELQAVRAASGAKYRRDDVVFWSKGRTDALLEMGGKTYKDCKAQR